MLLGGRRCNVRRSVLLFLLLISFAVHGQVQPKVFAPGVISGRDIVGVTFLPDMRTVVFCETDREIKHIQIMESHRVGERWSDPKPASFSDGSHRDLDPFITPDGKHLIFESDRGPAAKDGAKQYDVYIVDRAANGWGTPRPISALNTQSNEVFATQARNGNIYFSSERPGGAGKLDVYFSRKTAQGFAPPENIKELNSPESDGNVAIAPDESFLIMVRDRDLYYSIHDRDHWSELKPVPGVNTPDNVEYAPALSPDGKYLYYTSTRFGEGKRLTPGTVYYVPLRALNLPVARR
jgi:WD40-like Beta Propeller Repeat